MEDLQDLNIELPFDLAQFNFYMYIQESWTYRSTYKFVHTLILVLFIIAKGANNANTHQLANKKIFI